MAQSGGRHFVTLILGLGVIGASNALGARVDWRAYAVIAFWVLENAVLSRWVTRAADFEARVRRSAVTILGDVVLLAVMYVVLDAVQYAGAVFFAHMLLIASATLPRRWTIGIAMITVLICSALVALAATYGSTFLSPVGLPSPRGNPLFLVGAIASMVLSASMLMHLQSRLVRSIRDAERRYITVVQAAAPAMARRFILTTGDTSAPDVASFLDGVQVPVLEKPFELAVLEATAQQVRTGLTSGPA
jgi:hypothetical protein